ncbi:hypothetical protein [Nitrosospira sp. NpAV]|uniref:hypothetical protein n=1 Tax=Nitrosospira sp. NpAV TaxID=58133 RepID=UPI0005A107AD|nr:hypothetical protein [Nitrosospira sp. NpAV]KIO48374.1 hypothetical protein SQ11_11470 [Nitrosospira sp. NpAV]
MIILNPVVERVRYAVFGVRGKAQRRGMVRPRRAEQCFPQEGVTPQRDAGASERGRGIPCAARSPLRGAPRATLRGAPFQEVATQPCAAKTLQFTP